jgi:hypothetical protein
MKKIAMVVITSFLFAAGTAYTVDLPQLKEGLWSIHKQTTTNPGNKKADTTSTLCRNHAYDQHVGSLAKNMKGCSVIAESFQGGKYVLQIRCKVASTVIDSKATATSEGDNATHSAVHATYTPAMAGMSEMTIIMDQKYVGDCPAGAQPGDTTQADGTVSHTWKQ